VLPLRTHTYLFIPYVPRQAYLRSQPLQSLHNAGPLRHCADDSSARFRFHRLLWAIAPIIAYLKRPSMDLSPAQRVHGELQKLAQSGGLMP
jgi:hypothetical protein